MFLERLGADAAVYGAFSPYAQQQMVLARVALAQGGLYYVYTEDGPAHAELSGRLYYSTPDHPSLPVAGDWVAARIVGPEQALVEAVLPRRTCLSRRAAGSRSREQPVDANVDVVFLVFGLDGDFNLRRLERYLALVAASGAAPVVVLNEADLCADLAGRMAETAAIARSAPAERFPPGGTCCRRQNRRNRPKPSSHWREFSFALHQIQQCIAPHLALKQVIAQWCQISADLAENSRRRIPRVQRLLS